MKKTNGKEQEMLKDDLHVYVIGGTDRMIAGSKDEAWELWQKHLGETIDLCDDFDIEMIPDDHPITIFDDNQIPKCLQASTWTRKKGKGYLCSIEW